MGDSQGDLGSRIRSCTAGLLCLTVAMLLTFGAVTAYVWPKSGQTGLLAALLASVVCLVPAATALLMTAITTDTPNALAGVLIGIFLRTGVPFFIAIAVTQFSSPLADVGFFGMVLINYFIALAVETVFAVRFIQANASTVVRNG